MNHKYECPKCKASRWKTVVKGLKYKCLNCGYVGLGALKEHFRKSEERQQKKVRAIVDKFNELLGSGKQAKFAVAYIAHKFRITDRTIYRYLSKGDVQCLKLI